MESKNSFVLVTKSANLFKITIDLLRHIQKNINIDFNKDGIFIEVANQKNTKLIYVCFEKDKMNYLSRQQLICGVNTGHLYNIIKCIKKKDSLKIEDRKNDLIITPIKSDFNGSSNNSLKILTTIKTEIEIPSDYKSEEISCFNKDILRIIKELQSIKSPLLVISKSNNVLKFYCEKGELYNSANYLGNQRDFDDDKVDWTQNFKMEDFVNLTKLINISNIVKFTCEDEMPLRMSLSNDIGYITLYLKSNEMITIEEEDAENENQFFKDGEE